MTNDERDLKAIYDVVNGHARNVIFASDILPLLQAVRAEYAACRRCGLQPGRTMDERLERSMRRRPIRCAFRAPHGNQCIEEQGHTLAHTFDDSDPGEPTPPGASKVPLKAMAGDDGRFHATHCELPPLHNGACGTLASKRPTAQEMMSEEDRADWIAGWHYCLHGYRVNPKCGVFCNQCAPLKLLTKKWGPCFTGADAARWEGER